MFKTKKNDVILLSAVTLVFLFVCARAVQLDFTHDEAYSFLNIKQFWYAQFLCNANSHWLNSGALKIASLLGLESNWALRWLSILCSGGLLILAYYFIRNLENYRLQFFAFTLLCLNPFVLDYFVLARGYVSGMFFECSAFYFLLKNKKQVSGKNAVYALTAAGLAAIANFNFFYFFSAFSLVFFYENYFSNGFTFLKNKTFYKHAFITLGFMLLVLRAILFIKRCSNDLLLGTSSFFEGIFTSSIDSLLYLNLGEKSTALIFPATLMFVCVVMALIIGLFRYSKHQNIIYYYSSLILILVLLLHLINHHLFNMMYPYYRSALSLFPFIGINLIFFFSYLAKRYNYLNYIIIIGAALLGFNFIRNIQFTHTFDFYHQSESKQCFELVKKLGAKNVGMCHEHFGVYINYYQPSDDYKYPFKGSQLNTYDGSHQWVEKDVLDEMDYLILYPPYNLSYYKKREIKFTAVKMYPITKTLVLKVN